MITTYSCIGIPTIETGSGSDNASKPVHNITIEIRSRSSLYRIITKFLISIQSRKQTDKVGDFFSSIMKNNPFYEYDYGRKKNNIRVISSNKYLQDQNSVVVINSTESKIYSTESIAFHEFSTRAVLLLVHIRYFGGKEHRMIAGYLCTKTTPNSPIHLKKLFIDGGKAILTILRIVISDFLL